MANRIANGYLLNPEEFSGGDETNAFLESLRFNIVDIAQAERSTRPRRRAQRRTGGLRHDERCPECKAVIGKMLEKAFGEVKPNHRFMVGSRQRAGEEFFGSLAIMRQQ